MIPDFTIEDRNTEVLLTPKTDSALAFAERHIDPEAETACDAYVVDKAYAQPIIDAIVAHGLSTEVV